MHPTAVQCQVTSTRAWHCARRCVEQSVCFVVAASGLGAVDQERSASRDLVLAKLERNIDRDREDVKRLAAHGGLDPILLKERYETELRPYLGRPEREDLTLTLWLEMIEEVQQETRK